MKVLLIFLLSTTIWAQHSPEAIKRMQRAKVSFAKKDYKKTIELLNAYSSEISDKSLYRLAVSYEQTEDYLNAVRIFSILVGKNPEKDSLHVRLGKVLLKHNQSEEAVKSIRKAIKINPKNMAAYTALLDIFKEKNNNYESRLIVQDMIKKFGDRPQFYNELCRIYTEDAYLKEAILNCQKAIQLNNKHPDNHAYLAKSYRDKDDHEAAQRVIKAAAKRFKDSELVQRTAGDFFFADENYGVASRYYSQAVLADRNSVNAQLGMAQSMFQVGKLEQSLTGFESACKLDQSTVKHFREATAKLRLDKNRQWEEKFSAKMYGCR